MSTVLDLGIGGRSACVSGESLRPAGPSSLVGNLFYFRACTMFSFSLKFKNFTIVFPFHTAWECGQYLPSVDTALSTRQESFLL